MRHLFICTIGPVQDFINTARRSRDLWYGSWMLSELSKAAAKEIANSFGLGALIFPAPSTLDLLAPASDLNVSNKILAFIETDDTKKSAGKVKSAIEDRLQALKISAFNRIKGEYDQENANIQVADLLEFYWVATLCEKDDDYPKARELAEQILAARKNTRNFKQLAGSENPKSSLDGNRESVINEKEYPAGNAPEKERKEKATLLYQNYGARPAERLSGVDLMKRLGTSPQEADLARFNSTSHFAALPFMTKTNRLKGAGRADELLNALKKKYEDKNWRVSKDGALLYESRLNDVIPRGVDDEFKKELKEILHKQLSGETLNPYYALLRADGDNMGVILDAQKTPDKHRKLSKALSNFAQLVPAILEKHDGRTIFSGGDDILAYLPLHTALDCLKELEIEFRKQVPAEKFSAEKDGKKIEPTLSGGLVITHHLSSLSEVLALSREAEKKAKDVKGKNALVIVLSKRSGVERVLKGKWQDLSQRLNKLVTFYREKSISKGTAHELHALNNTFSGIEIEQKALEAEALRIIKRKKESGGENSLSEDILKTFEIWLRDKKLSLDELAQEMIAAGVFAQAINTACGDEECKQDKKEEVSA